MVLWNNKFDKSKKIENVNISERGVSTADLMDSEATLGTTLCPQICGQVYAHKSEDLDEMEQFLRGYHLPKVTQGEADNQNRSLLTM